MTDKEYNWTSTQGLILLVAGLIAGLIIGGLVVSLRYDNEILTDQAELQAQVDEIIEDRTIIDDLVNELLHQVESLKLERQELRELQILLSKGE